MLWILQSVSHERRPFRVRTYSGLAYHSQYRFQDQSYGRETQMVSYRERDGLRSCVRKRHDDFEASRPGFTLAITLAIRGTKQHAFRLLTNVHVAQEVKRCKAELMGPHKIPWDDEAATTQLSQ